MRLTICLLALALLVPGSLSDASAQVPTPRVRQVEAFGAGLVLRAPLPGTESFVGLALVCAGNQPRLQVQLGFFPPQPMALQLGVRAGDGTVERFGPVFTADSRSGIHAPELVDRAEIARFIAAAFSTAALVSNGYVSFFNDAGPAAGRQFRQLLDGCG